MAFGDASYQGVAHAVVWVARGGWIVVDYGHAQIKPLA